MNKKLITSSLLMVAVATPIIATSLHSYQIKNENKNEIKIENNVEKFKEMRWSKIPSYEKLNSFLFLENEIKNDELKTAQNRNLPPQTIVYIIISAVVGLIIILIIIFIIISVVNNRKNKKLLRKGPRIVRRPPVHPQSTNAQLLSNIESKQVSKTVELNKSVVNASISPTGKVEVKNDSMPPTGKVEVKNDSMPPTGKVEVKNDSMPPTGKVEVKNDSSNNSRRVQPTPPKKANTTTKKVSVKSMPNRKVPPTPPKKTATKKQTKTAAKKAKKTNKKK